MAHHLALCVVVAASSMTPALSAASSTGMEDFTSDFTQVFGRIQVDPWHKAHCTANVKGCAYKCHYNEGCIAFRMTGSWACQFFFEPRADLGGFEPETLSPSEGTYILKSRASAAVAATPLVEKAPAAVQLRGSALGASAAAVAGGNSSTTAAVNSSSTTLLGLARDAAVEEPQLLSSSVAASSCTRSDVTVPEWYDWADCPKACASVGGTCQKVASASTGWVFQCERYWSSADSSYKCSCNVC